MARKLFVGSFAALVFIAMGSNPVRADNAFGDLAISDGTVVIGANELRYAYENAPLQVRQQAANNAVARYELIASLVGSKRIAQNLEALEGSDPELFYRFRFAVLAAAKEFDERRFQSALEVPNLEALTLERYRVSRQDIAVIPEQRVLSHILLLCSEGCEENEKTEALESFKAELASGESFADLAIKHSEDPGSYQNGGRLSRPIVADDPKVDETFRTTAFSLTEVGEVSAVVKSRFGFHIMRLEEIIPAREQTYEEMAPVLREEVERRYREEAYRSYLLSVGPTDDLRINGDVVNGIMGVLAEDSVP